VWTQPTAPDFVLFALLGTLGVVAHIMLAHAFARVEAARLAPISYLTLVWAVLFGFLFFAEIPSLATLGGASLIMFGTLVSQQRRS
jgi:S-adenosylmethionine uptake transporter